MCVREEQKSKTTEKNIYNVNYSILHKIVLLLSKTASILINKGRIFLFFCLIMLSCVAKLLRLR